MRLVNRFSGIAALALAWPAIGASPVWAAAQESATPAATITYADLADLADSAALVLRAQVRKVARVDDRRAPGLRPGWGRLYIQGRTRALLTGEAPRGEAIAYLADVPLDARGKPPKLKKEDVLLFARPVSGRPGELQLVAPDAQVRWSPAVEQQVRAILTELVVPGAPGKIIGVRELIHVPGNLAGAGETQIFLETADGSAASITVQHKPGAPPQWGASFSELVADVANPPRRDTLAWYRLACFLPDSPPAGVNHSETPGSRARAEADYRMVLGELGTCERGRR